MPKKYDNALELPIDNNILRENVRKGNRKEGGDWGTIDWLAENNNADDYSMRRHASKPRAMRDVFSNSQGLWSALTIGLALGGLGVFAEAATHFIVNIRIGICAEYFWLGREQCCAGGEEDCENFYTWGQFFGANPRHRQFTDYIFYVFFTCMFAMAAAAICKFYNAFAAGGGINEVKTIVSGHQKSRYLGGWTLGTKVMAMCFSTGCGLSVGKEGPFVHIGASVGYILSSLFPEYNHHESKRRELIAAGSAAGIAVAFGAPVGGVLFALEEISSFYNFKALMQALVAGVVAVLFVKRIDMFHTGRIVQFSINYTHQWHWFELPLFAIIGCVGGFVGSLYNVYNIKWCAVRKANFKEWKILELGILGFVSGTFNFIVPYCKQSMLELLGALFQDCSPGSSIEMCKDSSLSNMIYFIIAGSYKMVLCALTVGCSVPAGLLVPSLCVGALLGRAFGVFVTALQQSWPDSFLFTECFQQDQCIVPGVYAIIGAAAVLCGVTRMTICLAVIMFELTGGLEYLVPVIIAILCAKSTGDALGVESIFEMGIEANNFPYLDPKKEFYHEAYAYDIFADKKWNVIESRGMTITTLNDLLENTKCTGFPVVASKDDLTLLGYITATNIKKAMMETATRRDRLVTSQTKVRFCGVPQTEQEKASDFELDYTDFVDSSVLQVEPNSSVQFLLNLFKALGIKKVIVSKYSKFQGILTKKDLIAFMRKVEHEEHELVHHLGKAMKNNKESSR